MADGAPRTREAFHALLDLVRVQDERFADDHVEGYLWLFQVLQAALETYVWADAARPELVPITSPTFKWGGDNADARYRYAPIDPRRRYVVRGRRGDAAYLSLTVYGGPDDGRWSTRIVGTTNDRELTVAPDGTFEVALSTGRPADGADWLPLADDAVALVTRDYLDDPDNGAWASWSIAALDAVAPPRLSDDEVATRLVSARNFLQELFGIFPLALDPAKANTVDEPYPVPAATYGWAAGDASYAMGSFELADDEALVIEGRSPECAFWNLCLWNPYLQTYDYRYENVTINGAQVDYEEDGSWRLVVAAEDPGEPNWISTAGHRRGLLWFRWFLPESPPPRPACRVVPRP